METLLMRSKLPLSRQSFGSFRCKSNRIGTDRVSVRARRGDGGEEDATSRRGLGSSSVGVSEEEGAVNGKRTRSLWQRIRRFGGRKLRFGEKWEVDATEERELEELDLFLEGRGLDFQWKDVLEPSVENVLALVLTGLFLYAGALIGWQLLLVAAAITLSALKYAVVAAIAVGVLIFFI